MLAHDGSGLRLLPEYEPFRVAVSSADQPDNSSRALTPITWVIFLRHPNLLGIMLEHPIVVDALAPSEPTDNLPMHMAASHGFQEEPDADHARQGGCIGLVLV